MSRPVPIPALAVFVAVLAWAAGVATPAVRADESTIPMAWGSLTIERGAPSRLILNSSASGDPAIAAAIERFAGRPRTISESDEAWLQWSADLPPVTGRWVLRQPLGLEPLLPALAAAGQSHLTLVIRHPRAAFVSLPGTTIATRQSDFTSFVVPTAGQPTLVFESGWRPADFGRIAGILLAVLLLPIAGGLFVRWRSVVRDRAAEACFGRAQAINVISMAGWALWMAAVEATRVTDLAEFALRVPAGLHVIAFAAWTLAYLPAILVLVAFQRDIVRRLRGIDPMPRGSAFALQSQMRVLVPLVFLLGAIGAFTSGQPKTGVFALIAAITAGILMPGGRGPLGLTPQALSSGALRDRLFDLAHRAGVKVRELYVVPLRRERMANAFAVHGGMVMVADDLLDRMSRREVDALLAHEISHLEHHHPFKAMLVLVAASSVMSAAAAPLHIPYAIPGMIVALWLLHLWVSRRFEFAADAGAAALTGDPEAVISGLGRLARLNDMPLTWRPAMRWCVTHPTTEARGLALGRRAGLAPERVHELLADGLEAGDHYGHAERPGEEARVYSSAWKTAALGRLALASIAVAALAPAAALGVAAAFGWRPPHAVAIPFAFAVALGVVLVGYNRLSAQSVAGLEGALRRALDDRREDGTLFAGLSPGDRARVYEGFLDWDLGLVTIEPERIRYRGEQIALDLPRAAVRAIEVGAAMPSWIRAPRVIVRWEAPGGEAALSLRAADARRVSAIGPASHRLAERLRAWHQAGAPAGGSHEAGAAAPEGIGPVTSRLPAEAVGLRDLPLLATLIAAFSAGAGILFGLGPWSALDGFAGALLAMLAVRWPALTSRERPSPRATEPQAERRAA